MEGEQQVLNRHATGLNLQYSPIQAPEGALLKADNCRVDREGVIERRRGMDYFNTSMAGTGAKIVGEYKDRLHVRQGTALFYDAGGGSWGSHTATLSPPDSSTRMRGAEDRSNFYIITSTGVWKKDELASEPYRAGMPPGLDMQISASGTGGGWMSPDTKVRYRICFSKEDANGHEIRGAPSYPEEFANPNTAVTIDWAGGVAIVTHSAHGYTTGDSIVISSAGSDSATYDGTHTITVIDANSYTYPATTVPGDDTDVAANAGKGLDLSVTFTLPDDLNTGDYYEIYRTEMSASATTAPGDRCLRVAQTEIDASDLTTGTITFTDTFNESYLGVDLYTNTTQETINKKNDRPPLAKDIALFDGVMHYANCVGTYSYEIQLKDMSVDITSYVLSLSDGVGTSFGITFGASESLVIPTAQVYTSNSTTAENIEDTMRSLVRVINRSSTNSRWYAHYSSGTEDPPGKVVIENRRPGQNVFYLTTSSATLGERFDPEITTTFGDAKATTVGKINSLYASKYEQPDHVPALNYDSVGSEEDPILRIIALRDSLLIFKDEEGVWRKDKNGFISQLDPSIRLLARESLAVLDNSAMCFTNQGVVRANENGTAIVSRAIESEMMKVRSFTNYQNITHAAAYEADRKYLLFVQEVSNDTTARYAWCYNYLTNGGVWTKWLLPCDSAFVLRDTDVLYAVHSDYEWVLQERKSINETTDYMDWELDDSQVTITATGTTTDVYGNTVTTVTLEYLFQDNPIVEGFLITQGAYNQRVTAVTDNGGNSYTLQLDELNTNFATGSATLTVNIPAEIEWVPEDGGNSFMSKQWSEAMVYLESDITKFHQLMFKTDAVQTQSSVRLIIDDQTSTAITPVRTWIPQQHQRSRTISLTYKNVYARENFEVLGMGIVFIPMSYTATGAPR